MHMLDNKIFYPLAIIVAIALVALSLVWPQGLGTRSPEPFGHAIEYPDYYRMVRERAARQKREAHERALRQTPAAPPAQAPASDASADQAADTSAN